MGEETTLCKADLFLQSATIARKIAYDEDSLSDEESSDKEPYKEDCQIYAYVNSPHTPQ